MTFSANSSTWPGLAAQHDCMFEAYLYEFSAQWKQQPQIKLFGYLQSWMYFKDYFADIRESFTFSTEITHKIKTFYDQITANSTEEKYHFLLECM